MIATQKGPLRYCRRIISEKLSQACSRRLGKLIWFRTPVFAFVPGVAFNVRAGDRFLVFQTLALHFSIINFLTR